MRRPKRNTRKSKQKKKRKWETPEDRVTLHANLLIKFIRERVRAKQRHEFTRKLILKSVSPRDAKHEIWLGECYR